MTLEELNSELKRLINTTVSFKRIAGNSIIIYFFGEPGETTVVSVFIDPLGDTKNKAKWLSEAKIFLSRISTPRKSMSKHFIECAP
jgi:hypothetical protein